MQPGGPAECWWPGLAAQQDGGRQDSQSQHTVQCSPPRGCRPGPLTHCPRSGRSTAGAARQLQTEAAAGTEQMGQGRGVEGRSAGHGRAIKSGMAQLAHVASLQGGMAPRASTCVHVGLAHRSTAKHSSHSTAACCFTCMWQHACSSCSRLTQFGIVLFRNLLLLQLLLEAAAMDVLAQEAVCHGVQTISKVRPGVLLQLPVPVHRPLPTRCRTV